MTLRSPWFDAGGEIPLAAAGPGVGQNISPPLAWTEPPRDTRELLLIIEDPDAPLPRPFVHLLAFGIRPDVRDLTAGALNTASNGLSFGRGTFGKVGYSGPRGLQGHGEHSYVFQVIALSAPLQSPRAPKLRKVLAAIGDTAIGRARLSGRFRRD